MAVAYRNGRSGEGLGAAKPDKGPSRRALLGAAVGFPFMGAACGEVAPPPGFTRSPSPGNPGEDWGRALGAFRAAELEVRGIEAATAGGSVEEEEALMPAHDDACNAMGAALGRVMRAAAPDPAAFAVKLELFFRHEVEPNSVDGDVAAAILGDARRLAGMA